MYRPLWSDQILGEVGDALEKKLYRTPFQRQRRLAAMRRAFPEATVDVPADLIEAITCIPDPKDRHVLAAAIRGPANAIITLNTKHFPAECLRQYDLVCQTPDEFLMHQFYLAPEQVLQKIDYQAAAIVQERAVLIQKLRPMVPSFAALAEMGLFTSEPEEGENQT